VAGHRQTEALGRQDQIALRVVPGQSVYFDLQTGGSTETLWRLTDPHGDTVFQNGFFFDAGTVTLTQGGDYTLTLLHRGKTGSSYVLKLWAVPAPERFPLTLGDTVAENLPAPGAGRIESPGAFDEYAFTATAGQALFLDLLSGGTPGLTWQLLDPDGAPVFSAGFFFDQATAPLAKSGTYTLRIGRADSDYAGAYGFRVTASP
jgi:hypothetical protein